MKVLHIGNTANFAYSMVKQLRKNGFEADLLIKKNCEPTADPRLLDPKIKVNSPKWIKYWNGSILEIPKLIQLFKQYDLIHAYAGVPLFIQFFGVPYVAHSVGTDLRKIALTNSFQGMLMRRAYNKSKKVIFSVPDQITAIEKLSLDAVFIPVPAIENKVIKKKKENVFRIFQPTRQDWERKGNIIFLNALKKLVKTFGKSIKVTLISWGKDIEKTRKFVIDNNLSKNVIFEKLMDKKQLEKQYVETDVIVDNLLVGSYGLSTLESMSYATPIIQFVKKDLFQRFFKSIPPILIAESDIQIYEHISFLINNKNKCSEIGKKSKEWALKYHDPQKVIFKVINVYKNL